MILLGVGTELSSIEEMFQRWPIGVAKWEAGAGVSDHLNEDVLSSVLARILASVESLRGRDFISRITPLLAEVIKADYVLIGRLESDGQSVRSLCVSQGERIVDNVSYSLAGTPCQHVSNDSICVYPRDVCQLFPEDKLLVDMGVQAYLGAPLHNANREVMGVLVALYESPIIDARHIENLFSLFAGRIAAEILSMESQAALEQELEKSRKLQEQYQLLARQERDARQRAQKANRVKSAFVANMSHEVKTPMNAMLAFCQMLLKSDLSQSQRLQVQNMLDAGQQLMTMLNDVLELSRLEDGVFELPENEVRSHSLLDNVVEQTASQLLQKPVKLSYSITPAVPPKLILSEYHIQKVVTNLLSNAVKFTVLGDIHVGVNFSQTDTDTGELTVVVGDTGKGIDPHFIDELFEPFTQQNMSHTRDFGGAGLGLHLAHKLISAMGGTIDVESVVGQGSVFTVHLPVGIADGMSERVLSTIGVVGLVSMQGNSHLTTNNLSFLGATVMEFDATVPLALQLVQCPVTAIIIDADSDSGLNTGVEHLIAEAKHEGVPVIAVMPKGVVLHDQQLVSLDGVACIQAPVLMNEWAHTLEAIADHSDVAEAAPKGRKARILLVEDNRLNQEIALCILEDAGYHVDIANNGQEAVASLQATPDGYQLVLMDIQMPVMDGLEATRIIREQLHNAVPIVAVTAGIAVQDRQQCDEAGMDDFIPKPIDEDFVLQKVRYYTSGAHQHPM